GRAADRDPHLAADLPPGGPARRTDEGGGVMRTVGWAKAAPASQFMHGSGSVFAHAVRWRSLASSDSVGKDGTNVVVKLNRLGRLCPPYVRSCSRPSP